MLVQSRSRSGLCQVRVKRFAVRSPASWNWNRNRPSPVPQIIRVIPVAKGGATDEGIEECQPNKSPAKVPPPHRSARAKHAG